MANANMTDPLKEEFMRRAGMAEGGSVAHFAIGGQEKSRNWLKGKVEGMLDPLMTYSRASGGRRTPAEVIQEMQETYPADKLEMMSDETKAHVKKAMQDLQHKDAINQWVQRNLANYIRKHMATHDDPIRKLAEEGIIHMPSEQVGSNRYQAGRVREKLGQPQLGKSEAAQAWEDAADVAMNYTPLHTITSQKDVSSHSGIYEPWMEKADPNTKMFYPTDSMHAHYLGFDHIVDVLKQDLSEGRIRPEQLNKISMEHAVRRVHDYDQERKRKMAETALKATEGMPVHAEYPEGYKWIELAPSKEKKQYSAESLPEGFLLEKDRDGYYQVRNTNVGQTPTTDSFSRNPEEAIAKFNQWVVKHNKDFNLEQALKYEGDTMGHCVGGYCPEVAAGNKRIYSLRDTKNEPHVTIEVAKPQSRSEYSEMSKIYDQAQEEANARNFATTAEFNDFYHDRVKQLQMELLDKKSSAMPPAIKQIKGKQNQKPKKEYIKFVQDFIKRGKWSDIGDLQNADLIQPTPHYLNQFYGPEDRPFIQAMEQKHGKDYWHPETIGEEYRAWNAKPKEGKADGGSVAAQEAKAKLDQLKQEFTQLAERDRRAAQAAWNAEQMANKKAKGGKISTDGMRYALTMKKGKKHG